jgi:hypothetical protein
MASGTVKAAVETRLQSWASLAQYPFFDENDVAPLPKTLHLTIEYPVANEDRITIGAKPAIFRETGAIRFVIHILNMSGLSSALTAIDSLRDLFREQTLGAGIETFEAPPAVFDKSNRSSTFYLLASVVTYRFDLLKS